MTKDTRTTNGVGWEIQTYIKPNGWVNKFMDEEDKPIIFKGYLEAETMFKHMELYIKNYRIYESLRIDPPKTKKWWEWWK